MRRLRSLYVAPALILIATAVPVAARQLEANDDPRVTGALRPAGKSCKRKALRTDLEEVAARAVECLYFYEFPLTSETDLLDDYGVAWLQTEITPEAGWCVLTADSVIEFASNSTITGSTPTASKVATSPARRRVVLDATAGGNAVEDARVSQVYKQLPLVVTTSLGRRAIRTAWEGRSDRRLAFALGVEFSHRTLGSSGEFAGGLENLTITPSRTC